MSVCISQCPQNLKKILSDYENGSLETMWVLTLLDLIEAQQWMRVQQWLYWLKSNDHIPEHLRELGLTPIEGHTKAVALKDVPIGAIVTTRDGLRKCTAKSVTPDSVLLVFEKEAYLAGSPEEPIFTSKGIQP